MNLFEILDLQTTYNIDINQLNQNYLTKLAKYHPDRAADEQEKEQYLNQSMDLNNAYYCLKDDLRRGEYLLSLNGIDLHDEDTRAIPTEKLEEIWFEREQVEEASDLEEIDYLSKRKNRERDEVIAKLHKAFSANNLKEATSLVIQLKYLHNFLKAIEAKAKAYANSPN